MGNIFGSASGGEAPPTAALVAKDASVRRGTVRHGGGTNHDPDATGGAGASGSSSSGKVRPASASAQGGSGDECVPAYMPILDNLDLTAVPKRSALKKSAASAVAEEVRACAPLAAY
eukprot:358772-Chlamydomonas_euryale.AAC.5